MCVQVICLKKDPTLAVLSDMCSSNPHGIGIAWHDKKKGLVRWEKGISLKALCQILTVIPFPHVMHFRQATSGGIKPSLCHPFPITRDVPLTTSGCAPAVLFHNGIWSRWEDYMLQATLTGKMKLPSGAFSDTRAIALLAATYGYRILNWIGAGKLIVFGTNGITKYGQTDYEKEDGYESSNGCHKYQANTGFRYTYDWHDMPPPAKVELKHMVKQFPPAATLETKIKNAKDAWERGKYEEGIWADGCSD